MFVNWLGDNLEASDKIPCVWLGVGDRYTKTKRLVSPMVLLDHFRPPLSTRRHWHAFHNAWATYLATDLNQRLPEGFFAEPNVQFGIEIDVAAFDETAFDENRDAEAEGLKSWQPPAPSQTIAFEPSDAVVEINILGSKAGPTLNAAIELVSPANKDRPQQRQAFVSKCESYLRQGIGLVVVDVVTTRMANLHRELLEKLAPGSSIPQDLGKLYAVAYRAVGSEHSAEALPSPALQIWYETFEVGEALPTLPLWLRQGFCLPLALQETYEETCRSQRIIKPLSPE